MDTVFSFTKDELIQAFAKYNAEAVQYPTGFGTVSDDIECATLQAEKLLSILEAQGSVGTIEIIKD